MNIAFTSSPCMKNVLFSHLTGMYERFGNAIRLAHSSCMKVLNSLSHSSCMKVLNSLLSWLLSSHGNTGSCLHLYIHIVQFCCHLYVISSDLLLRVLAFFRKPPGSHDHTYLASTSLHSRPFTDHCVTCIH
jgi:hypothetical protein